MLDGHVFESRAETPLLRPAVELLTVGPRQLRVGIVLPHDHEPGSPLPVLMDPYGGPHFLRVQAVPPACGSSRSGSQTRDLR